MEGLRSIIAHGLDRFMPGVIRHSETYKALEGSLAVKEQGKAQAEEERDEVRRALDVEKEKVEQLEERLVEVERDTDEYVAQVCEAADGLKDAYLRAMSGVLIGGPNFRPHEVEGLNQALAVDHRALKKENAALREDNVYLTRHLVRNAVEYFAFLSSDFAKTPFALAFGQEVAYLSGSMKRPLEKIGRQLTTVIQDTVIQKDLENKGEAVFSENGYELRVSRFQISDKDHVDAVYAVPIPTREKKKRTLVFRKYGEAALGTMKNFTKALRNQQPGLTYT